MGFQELRQACEISRLREDLDRVMRQRDALKARIDQGVDRVRTELSALSADDLADADMLLPLLQTAISVLTDIRTAANRMGTASTLDFHRPLDPSAGPAQD
jgi:hypothetical protein